MMKFESFTRYFSLIALLVTGVAAWAATPGPKAPPFLRPGDKVAIISPSSAVGGRGIDSACSVLSRWGYVPVVEPHARDRSHGYAGTAANRAADLLAALQDTAVHAILASDGGYGANQVLCLVPQSAFRDHPKWIIGYSDITALLSAQVCAGNMAIHGNMCARLRATSGTDTTSRALRNLLAGQLPAYKVASHPLNHPGTAHGILVGGNLSVFNDLAGSRCDFLNAWFLHDHDVILFFEDVHEGYERIDRMLHHLKLRGVLDQVKGIVVGKFKDYTRHDRGWDSMEEMLNSYLKDYDIPICYSFPVSHYPDKNFPMIEGCPVTLNVQADSTSLTFSLPGQVPPPNVTKPKQQQ